MDNQDEDGLTIEQQIAKDLADLWKDYKGVVLAQVDVLERASRAAANGELPDELREEAQREAHKLAGSVGSFGFTQGSALASEIEKLLKADGEIDGSRARQLAKSVDALRRELDKP